MATRWMDCGRWLLTNRLLRATMGVFTQNSSSNCQLYRRRMPMPDLDGGRSPVNPSFFGIRRDYAPNRQHAFTAYRHARTDNRECSYPHGVLYDDCARNQRESLVAIVMIAGQQIGALRYAHVGADTDIRQAIDPNLF